jgi:hypothetical protein
MDDSVRMLAVALLNLADDEGYFYADPSLIRSSVWPFDDDSSKARRALEQLSKVGWIEIVECAEIGQIGRVVNFTKHQKVDRPSPSKIKGYTASSNIRRTLDDDSLLEQGTGNREQGRKEAPPSKSGDAPPEPVCTKPVNGSPIAFATFMARCKEHHERPIADYRPVWEYAERVGIPEDAIVLAWQEFGRRYGEGGGRSAKRYRDWRQAFRNAVEENWMGLWTLDEQGRAVLTTRGRIAEKVAA